MEQKYFAVTTKCGHVRRNKYIEVTFAIAAEDGKQAAEIGRNMPRVKHDDPMAIINVVKLSYEEYLELLAINSNNPYLQCKNKQEQNVNCPDIYKIVKDMFTEEDDYKEKRNERLCYLFKKRKIFDRTEARLDYAMI